MHHSSLFLCVLLLGPPLSFADPAEPDRPISDGLIKVPYEKIKVEASSVSNGFSERNLFRMKAWRAWGSEVGDRVGAWLKFTFESPLYLDTIHYVPGDERAPGFFDKMCARPKQVEVRTDFETRVIDLPDVKLHQYVTFDPPIVTQQFKMVITEVRGNSEQGGVCLAAISFYVHRDPLVSIPDLKARAEQGLALLKKPLMRAAGELRLSSLGPVIAPLILTELKASRGKTQQVLLEASIRFLTSADLPEIMALEAGIEEGNRFALLKLRAALGDRGAAASLMSRLGELEPSEQAKLMHSIAAAHNSDRLTYLIEQFGLTPEVDEVLKLHIPSFTGAYELVQQYYQRAVGRKKASLLELLARINPEKAEPELRRALSQREDSMWKSGAIRGVAYSQNANLRALVRKLAQSVYGMERRATAFALAEWGLERDIELLKELAADRSMSVRKEALQALGRAKGTSGFLKQVATLGSDAGTAEAAAQAWLSSEARMDVHTPLSLFESPFPVVRKLGIHALIDHQDEACEPLSVQLLRTKKVTAEHILALEELWEECGDRLMQKAIEGSSAEQERGLIIAKLTAKTDFVPMIMALAQTEIPEIQIAVAKASGVLSLNQIEMVLKPYLLSDLITTRCAALDALAQQQSELTHPVIERDIRSGLPDPYQADRAALLCAVDAAGLLKTGIHARLLALAYKSWSKSLGYLPFRRRVIHALVKLPTSPDRLSALIDASTDLDHEVRDAALAGLRRR